MAAHNDWTALVCQYDGVPDHMAFKDADMIDVEDTGNGNLNEVQRVFTKDHAGNVQSSVIIKHSLPYIKCLGEGYPLSARRIDMEFAALAKFHALSPGSVPQPYHFDKENNAVCMEDLLDYDILRTLLMRGEFDADLANHIGHHLAAVHGGSHVNHLRKEAFEQLSMQFENSLMSSITEQFVFTRPFTEGDETNKSSPEVQEHAHLVLGDDKVLDTIRKLLKLFKEKKECLTHGDLHTGSVMIKGTDARIIDMEFARIGPAAFDIGLIVANFIFSYYRNMSIQENNNERRKFAHTMVDACKKLVTSYLEHLTTWIECGKSFTDNFLTEVAGFAGCEILRRDEFISMIFFKLKREPARFAIPLLLGAAHNDDLEGMPLAEVDCFKAGVRLIKVSHRIHNIDQLTVIALMLA